MFFTAHNLSLVASIMRSFQIETQSSIKINNFSIIIYKTGVTNGSNANVSKDTADTLHLAAESEVILRKCELHGFQVYWSYANLHYHQINSEPHQQACTNPLLFRDSMAN